MPPDVRFCTASDGVLVAYGVSGAGEPLVVCPALVEQFSTLPNVPTWQTFIERLAEGRTLVQYDGRGTGLSDRRAGDLSQEARVRDLEAVVEATGLSSFALYGSLLAGPLAILYAARHPERVSHLILYGTFSRGQDVMPWERLRPLLDLSRNDWHTAAQTFADMSTRQQHPQVGIELAAHFRQSTTGEAVADGMEGSYLDDSAATRLSDITAPTLVLHRRNDPIVPFALGQELAAGIPNARFVPLEGSVHAEFLGDPEPLLLAIHEFLGTATRATRPRVDTGAGPLTILFTDIEGSTTLTQRLGDVEAQEVLRVHNAIVREALAAHGGSEVKHTGDGIMASFPSPSFAVDCAVAVQRAVDEGSRVAGRGSREALRVRIGINAGEPVREDDDLFGTAVQLARRICDAGGGGEVLVSDVVRQLVAGKGFRFAYRGDQALKGFEEPVRLYQVAWGQ